MAWGEQEYGDDAAGGGRRPASVEHVVLAHQVPPFLRSVGSAELTTLSFRLILHSIILRLAMIVSSLGPVCLSNQRQPAFPILLW